MCSLLLITVSAMATEFNDGPIIKGFGKHAPVNQSRPLAGNEVFKVVFDVAKQTGEGKVNRQFNSLARFINMHVANGIKPENIHLALVVHGKAGLDVLSDAAYQKRYKQANPNQPLLALLQQANTQIFICGQSAAYYKIAKSELSQGVKMSLSAMTANALLQQQGYSVNPF
ncbi:DsrE family protein [Thalassotalea sp. M1531]|uniref:DsrE family protein n=2 Tax=Thalassotalea algicola TaxID=2716224 RepID=A0A7Y0LBD5_9GAMM|nr:DsrE family protein [Thalassotalea algicola]